jgi:integrase
MGTILLPLVVKSLPRGAEIIEKNGERTARWRNSRGAIRTAEVRTTPRGDCIAIHSGKYVARYKDAHGVVRSVPTQCRDRVAAQAVLARLEHRAELVRAGVISAEQDAVSDHRRAPIQRHIDGFIDSLRARGDCDRHVANMRRFVATVITECNIRALRDVRRETIEKWLLTGANVTRSARTRNSYLGAVRSLMRWCVETDRILADPLARIRRADERADRRRQPRAFSPDELRRLLDAARRRPVEQGELYTRGWRRKQPGVRLRPETRAKVERLGRERSLIYKTLVMTGLRLGELAAVRVRDVVLDGPYIVLDAKHEKARRGATIPLRQDLAEDLRGWIESERALPDRKLFNISYSLLKVFVRDLAYAGIPKLDDRGRTACLHSLRHTFATLMSRGGVAPRVAQAAMRHSTIDLTMTTYTDARLLDVAGALDVLPQLPLEHDRELAVEGA